MKTFSPSQLLLALLLCFACVFTGKAQIRFRSYHPGHYYDIAGVKHTGFIDFGRNYWGTVKINFKPDSLHAENQKIDLSAIRAVVVAHKADEPNNNNKAEQDGDEPDGKSVSKKPDTIAAPAMVTDSLIVEKEIEEIGDEPTIHLCKFVVEASNDATIYSRQQAKNGPGVGMMFGGIGAVAVGAAVNVTYDVTVYLCNIDDKTFLLKRSNYKDLLSRAFSDDPDLVKKIQNKEIRFGELDAMINLYVRFKSPKK